MKPRSLSRRIGDSHERPFVATRRNGNAPIVISELTLRQTAGGDIDLLVDDSEYHYRIEVETAEGLIDALKAMVRAVKRASRKDGDP